MVAQSNGVVYQSAINPDAADHYHSPEFSIPPIPGAIELDTDALRLERMRRSVITSARIISEDIIAEHRRFKAAFLTCTYRPDEEWNPRQITGLVKNVREYLRVRGEKMRYVWVLELTKAGRPHYHMVIWLPKGLTLPKPDKRGWWPYGFTKIEWARNPVGYIAKYTSKGVSLDGLTGIPKGARLNGNGGLSAAGRCERTWWGCPAWVRAKCAVDDRPARAEGGGYVLRASGIHLPSPWRMVGHSPGWRLVWLAPALSIG